MGKMCLFAAVPPYWLVLLSMFWLRIIKLHQTTEIIMHRNRKYKENKDNIGKYRNSTKAGVRVHLLNGKDYEPLFDHFSFESS